MKFVNIPIGEEPHCLRVFKYPEHSFRSDLKDDCKREVQNKLSRFQNKLCAYCERELKGIFIEHYLPISTHPDNQFDWSNFLAVCLGNFGPKTIQFCNRSRDAIPLTIDPRVQEHMLTIFFEDVTIRSTCPVFDTELNEALNLNCIELCELRAAKFKELENTFLEDAMENNLNQAVFYDKLLKYVRSNHLEFYSYLISNLEKLINSLKL